MPFDLFRQADHFVERRRPSTREIHCMSNRFGVVGCQNRAKNGRVMPIESWGKSGVLAYFWLKIGYFGHIF